MAGRVKADCGANLIEHSYALMHLIPVGLRVIGHLGSGVNGFAYCVLYDTYKRRGEVAVRGDGWRAGCLRVASSETTQITSSYPTWRARRGHGRAFASPSTGEFFRTDPRQAVLLVLRSEHMIHRRPARYRRLLGLAQMS